MADVQPLRGIRYTSKASADLAQVVTPPFDVISSQAQARYYARNPYNVIRLELPEEHAGDNSLNNRYTRAAITLAEWRMTGILQQDASPRYYLYQQVFTHRSQPFTRTSLLARVRLEPWSAGVILPHERTMPKLKDDRLKLMRACATNFSPLMSFYDDPQGRMRRLLAPYANNAEVEIADEAGEGHLLQPITDAQHLALIQDFFSERQLYIADGHHRYETALNYREEVREQRLHLHVADAANFVLMALIDIDDPGMLVLPTHRLLFGLSQQTLSSLSSKRLGQYFIVQELGQQTGAEELAVLEEAHTDASQRPAMLISTSEQSWLLRLNDQGERRMMESGHSVAWNGLDVAVAHTLVVEELLGLSIQDVAAGTSIRYTHDAQEALQAVQTGEAQVALLLNATRVRQISDVAQTDDRMPQKSTYFYPKLITGLVINPLW